MQRTIVRDGVLAAVWVSSGLEQLESVLVDLDLPVLPQRCMACGGELRQVSKAEVLQRIPPRTARWKDEAANTPRSASATRARRSPRCRSR